MEGSTGSLESSELNVGNDLFINSDKLDSKLFKKSKEFKETHEPNNPPDGDVTEEFYTDVLTNLPHEIWSLILDYVPQKDRLKARGVNKKWSKMIDEWSTFKIEYNKIQPDLLPHVLNLRIRACEFSGLKTDLIPSLTHPLLVREVTFGACVNAENARNVLSACTNIELLRCFSTSNSDTAFESAILNHKEYLKNLKKLKCLEIGILFFGRRNPSSISNTFKTLIGDRLLVFSGISQIIIDYAMTKTEWIEFCHFTSRHFRTLTGINISQCICEAISISDDNDTFKEKPDLNLLRRCRLSSLVTIRRSGCNCNGDSLWSNVLASQNKIKKLWTNIVPNLNVIRDFIKLNQLTITSLKLYDIYLGVDAGMNGSMFQECHSLRELELNFQSCAVIVINVRERDIDNKVSPITKRYSEFYGLQLLPKSIQKLSIAGCLITTSSLMEASNDLTNLQELSLGDPRSGSLSSLEYGFNGDVLLLYMKNIELSRLQIDANFLKKNLVERQENKMDNLWDNAIKVFSNHGIVEVVEREEFSPNKSISFSSFEILTGMIDLRLSKFDGNRQQLIDLCQTLDRS